MDLQEIKIELMIFAKDGNFGNVVIHILEGGNSYS